MKKFRVVPLLSPVQQQRECTEAFHQAAHALAGYTATQGFTAVMNCAAVYAHHQKMTREQFLLASGIIYDAYADGQDLDPDPE
jgi:hypothetical protein